MNYNKLNKLNLSTYQGHRCCKGLQPSPCWAPTTSPTEPFGANTLDHTVKPFTREWGSR
jgi:hypothetical protein